MKRRRLSVFAIENKIENKGPLGTILIADDDEDARSLLERMLRAGGYRVLVACDGSEALHLMQERPVDLALLDVFMPGESGFTVCRFAKLRPETRLTPVVLITGLGSTEDRIRGI